MTEAELYIVLEGATLKTATIGKEVTLLNSDEHQTYIRKKLNQDPAQYRPDICHFALLTLLDSPLAKSGKLRVFVRTSENVLIAVDPSTKIPRTYRRFAMLFAQLLTKLKIRAVNSSKILLRTIKNPVTDHVPTNTKFISISNAGALRNPEELAEGFRKQKVALVLQVCPKPDLSKRPEYATETFKISNFLLSSNAMAAKLAIAFEKELVTAADGEQDIAEDI